MTKPTYILTDDCFEPIYAKETNDGSHEEYKTEKAALQAAKGELKSMGFDREVWVWRLSHVVSTPIVVDAVVKVIQ